MHCHTLGVRNVTVQKTGVKYCMNRIISDRNNGDMACMHRAAYMQKPIHLVAKLHSFLELAAYSFFRRV